MKKILLILMLWGLPAAGAWACQGMPGYKCGGSKPKARAPAQAKPGQAKPAQAKPGQTKKNAGTVQSDKIQRDAGQSAIPLSAGKPFTAPAPPLCSARLSVKAAITPVTLEALKNSLAFAKKESCSSLLVEIDTPGGSLPATRLIVQEILNSPLPVFCLVSPAGAQATSAGAIILQACHVSGAIKGTNLGASTPVMMGKDMEKESDMRKKAINDTVSFVESLTNWRKRNKIFGKEIVTKAKSVTAEEAFKLKAIDWTGDSVKSFLAFADGREVKMAEGKTLKAQAGPLKTFPLGFRYYLLAFFADPQILYLLFLGSVMLIYFELTHPGVMAPGVVGAVGLLISLMGLNALSVAWGAVALIFLGLALFTAEMFLPSFGVLGVGGLVSFLLGSVYLFDPVEMGGYQLPLGLIFSSVAVIGLLIAGAALLAMKTIRMKRDITGMGTVIGKEGEVAQISNKEGTRGWLSIHGENWRFRSDSPLKLGDEVVTVRQKRMTLYVKKQTEKQTENQTENQTEKQSEKTG